MPSLTCHNLQTLHSGGIVGFARERHCSTCKRCRGTVRDEGAFISASHTRTSSGSPGCFVGRDVAPRTMRFKTPLVSKQVRASIIVAMEGVHKRMYWDVGLSRCDATAATRSSSRSRDGVLHRGLFALRLT
jgi:hypothetical protein